MNDRQEWEILFQAEINRAENARSAGNEGMARVCARRAVGIVLEEYYHRKQILLESPSAYDRMRFIEKLPDISDEILTMIQHFLVRVSPDYSLPVEADLIAEAQQLEIILLNKQSS
jgi:hypothetical protein